MAGIPTPAQFRRGLAGTPMAAEADAIYRAAIAGGLNPAFVAGLAGAESGFGRDGYAVGSHNPFGLGVHLGWTFPTYAAATTKLAKTLKGLGYPKLYKQSGLRGIIGQYTPYGDASNDPNAHTANIKSLGARTGGDASIVYTGAGAGGSAGVPGPPQTGRQPGPAPGKAADSGLGADAMKAIMDYFSAAQASIQDPEKNPVIQDVTPYMARIQAGVRRGSADTLGTLQGPDPAASIPTPARGTVGPDGTIRASGSFMYPLGTRGTLGGSPYGGTHTRGNWQSDNAVDLMVATGTPVYATTTGIIGDRFGALGSGDPRLAGLRLNLIAPSGPSWYYAHLSRFAPGIKPGVRVRPGQLLGYSGSANGADHLHLGVESGNPLSFLGLK